MCTGTMRLDDRTAYTAMDQRNETDTSVDAARPTTPVDLPRDAVTRVEARLDRSEFDSVAEYVTFVLEEVLAHVEDATDRESVDIVDRREVETRLQSLGYLE